MVKWFACRLNLSFESLVNVTKDKREDIANNEHVRGANVRRGCEIDSYKSLNFLAVLLNASEIENWCYTEKHDANRQKMNENKIIAMETVRNVIE